MPIVRTVARGVVVLSLLAAGARADSTTVKDGGSDNWTFYLSGSDGSGDRKDLSGLLTSQPSAPAPQPAANNPPPPAPAPVSPPPSSAGSQPVFAANSGQNIAPAAPGTADALINFGTSNFPEANLLTTGNPQSWFLSKTVTDAFHGTPTADQQTQFTNEVLADVRHTFDLAGLHPKLTTDPSVQVSHTLSVVSGASYGPNAGAIGITDVGRSGFGFIDKLDYASNPDELAWAVAHNISHELMHAFGIGTHPDATGNYIDAATASWALLTNGGTTFSPAATDLLSNTNFGAVSSPSVLGKETLAIDGAQEIIAAVPEPAAVATWSLVVAGALLYRRTRAVRAAA